jgi:segregation and condensation protein B
VNVDGVSRLLEQRGYIEEVGRAGGPGQPILYGTTELFLDRMALATLSDLPPIEEFMPPIETANQLVDEMNFEVDESTEVS